MVNICEMLKNVNILNGIIDHVTFAPAIFQTKVSCRRNIFTNEQNEVIQLFGEKNHSKLKTKDLTFINTGETCQKNQ